MNIEQLIHIVEVSKTRSITSAAQNLHISISAISQSISNLEKEFGTKIFERSRQGTIPTDKGKKIIKNSNEVLIQLQKLKEEAQIDASLIHGKLKIATIPGFMKYLIKSMISFNTAYPNVSFEIIETGTPDIIEKIQQNKIDMGFVAVYGDILNKGTDLSFEVWMEGKIKVYVSKNSPLAFQDTISPQELLNQTAVYYNGDQSFIDDFFESYGPLNILFSSNNTEELIKAGVEGTALGFASDFTMINDPHYINGDLVAIELVNHHSTKSSSGWIYSNTKHFSNTANIFLEYIKNDFPKHHSCLDAI